MTKKPTKSCLLVNVFCELALEIVKVTKNTFLCKIHLFRRWKCAGWKDTKKILVTSEPFFCGLALKISKIRKNDFLSKIHLFRGLNM